MNFHDRNYAPVELAPPVMFPASRAPGTSDADDWLEWLLAPGWEVWPGGVRSPLGDVWWWGADHPREQSLDEIAMLPAGPMRVCG